MDKISRMWELAARKDELFDRFIRVSEELLNPVLWDGWMALQRRELVTAMQEIVHEKVLLDAEILKLTDCQPLLDKVGRELHEMYQQKYPITKNTGFLRQPGLTQIRYHIPQQVPLMTPYEEMPVKMNVNVGNAKVETWGMGDWFRIRLAYAPEIDTIFWSEA